jgi:purine-nucleoside phosphorylase
LTEYTKQVSKAAEYIRSESLIRPLVAVVLGSGLGSLAEDRPDSITIPYKSIPYFSASSVPGHSGNLVLCEAWGLGIAFMQGRFHFYEGLSMAEIAFPVRVLNALGANNIIVTNASGGISEGLKPGSFMIIEDHINLMGANPLIGIPQTDDGLDRFVDMTCAYDPGYIELAVNAGKEAGVPVRRGVLAALPGPCYETPAEIMMLKSMGADAVSMSTVPEVIMARYLGMKVLGISLISNRAAGLSKEGPSHGEVLDIARESRGEFDRLLSAILAEISQLLP